MGKLTAGIIKRHWERPGADGVCLSSGQLRTLEVFKSRLEEQQRARLRAAIERQSRQ